MPEKTHAGKVEASERVTGGGIKILLLPSLDDPLVGRSINDTSSPIPLILILAVSPALRLGSA